MTTLRDMLIEASLVSERFIDTDNYPSVRVRGRDEAADLAIHTMLHALQDAAASDIISHDACNRLAEHLLRRELHTEGDFVRITTNGRILHWGLLRKAIPVDPAAPDSGFITETLCGPLFGENEAAWSFDQVSARAWNQAPPCPLCEREREQLLNSPHIITLPT